MGVLDDWMSLDDAVKLSRRSRRTLYRWAERGIVRTVRPADVIYFNVPDLRKAMSNTRGLRVDLK